MKSITLVAFKENQELGRYPFIQHDADIFTLLIKLTGEETSFSIEAKEDNAVFAYGPKEETTVIHLNQAISLEKEGSAINLESPHVGIYYFNVDLANESEPTFKVKKGLETDSGEGSALNQFLNSELPMSIEIGRTKMLIDDVLTLGQGSVIELNRLVGEELEVYVGEIRVAIAEMVTIGEEFAVRLTKVLPVAKEMADTFNHLAGE